MKKSEVKKIIDNYKPHLGFYDLSIKPETLSMEEYAVILQTQNYLALENEKFKVRTLRKNNKRAWEEVKRLAGELQEVVLKHWNACDLR